MKEFQVTVATLHPLWVGRLGVNVGHLCTVRSDGQVELFGQLMDLSGRVPAGTRVMVYQTGNGFFRAMTEGDWGLTQTAKGAAAKAERERVEQEKRERNAAAVAEAYAAQAFNSRIKLPVAWDVSIKDTKHGLREDSFGDGRGSVTVEHILLKEPLEAGRLKRDVGDFLCSANSKDNGLFQLKKPSRLGTLIGGVQVAPAVSCKACLKLAERWTDPAEERQ